MQKSAAASLVSVQATPSLYTNHIHSTEDPDLISSDVQPQPLPTPEQQAALDELLVFDNEKIFAWLTILRSIEPDFWRLSKDQLDALSTLKDCGDSDILAWLTLGFFPGDVNRQRASIDTVATSGFPILSTSRRRRRPSTNSSLRSSISSSTLSTVFSSKSGYGTPRSSLGHGTTLPGLPEGFASTDEPEHAHWCTYDEHLKPKPIGTCEGWKRHEKEHESYYRCMPNGAVEYTQNGRICVLCHEADPDANHLAKHNISICVGSSKKPLKKSRRIDMVKHLKEHRVHSTAATALADQWRYALPKKCFSCGLCVMIFYSITERSNHIDNEHWKRGQNMDAWELSNCIHGLLLEPKLQAAWNVLLRSYPDLAESSLWWELPSAEGLQLRLEMREDSEPVLARAALELSNFVRIRQDQEVLVAATGREKMMLGPVLAAPRSPAAATVTPFSSSTYPLYPSLLNHAQPPAPLSRLLPGSPSSNNIDILGTGFQNPQRDSPLNPLAFLDDSYQPDFTENTFISPGTLTDSEITDIPSQLSIRADPTKWPSMLTTQLFDDKSRIQVHLNESGASLVAQVSSPLHGEPANYAAIDGQGLDADSRDDVTASSTSQLPISRFHHRWTAQPSNREYGFGFREKPLPTLPPPDPTGNPSGSAEHRPNTPMDLGIG